MKSLRTADRGALFLVATLFFAGCAGSGPKPTPDGASETAPAGGTVFPWSSGGIKIGYIRSDVISARLPDYRDADNTLNSENAQWTSEADQMEADLRVKETQFEELKLILGAERRKQLEDEITAARKELQRFRQQTWYDEESKYIRRRKELMEPIDARVNDAIYQVAETRGLDLVLDTVAGNVVYAKPGLDITDLVLEELQR